MQESIAVFTVIKLAGAAYLVHLGVQSLRHRRALADALYAPVERKLLRRILADGFVVGMFNPKVIVFFMAVLPQFVDRSAGSVPAQLLTLGAIFCAIALLCDSTWALLAGAARTWLLSSPRRPRDLQALAGPAVNEGAQRVQPGGVVRGRRRLSGLLRAGDDGGHEMLAKLLPCRAGALEHDDAHPERAPLPRLLEDEFAVVARQRRRGSEPGVGRGEPAHGTAVPIMQSRVTSAASCSSSRSSLPAGRSGSTR